jgi:hypothetical protein
MSSNAIYKAVKRSNMNTLIVSVIVLAIAIAAGGYWSVPYFTAMFTGPTPVEEAALAEITAESGTMYFQQIKADEVIDAGYEEYTEYDNGSQRTDAYFAVAVVGERLVIVRLANPVDESQTVYTGTFKAPDSVQREIFDDFRREYPDIVDYVVPLLLDTKENTVLWYGGTGVLVLLLLGGIWGVINFIQRSANPNQHPILKKLAAYGDVESVADSIDKELNSMPDELGKLKLTRNWVVYGNGGTFEAIPYRDLVWVYKMIQQNKSVKSYFAHICDRNGKLIAVPAKEEQVNTMLQAILSRAPWSFAGYSEDLKKAWDKDRQQLVVAVEQRKAQFDTQNPFA